MSLGVAILGAGLIGRKRASALPPSCQLLAVFDPVAERAASMAKDFRTEAASSVNAILKRDDIAIVIVAATNRAIPQLAAAALEMGKDVLIEKPGGRNPTELQNLETLAQRHKRTLCVGFNHRFHPAIQRVKQELRTNTSDPLMYIRARYGHGGRVGYEKEWRAIPAESGGGELLDQGVHLIDLCRFLGGEFSLHSSIVTTSFWNMPVEDNGVLILRQGQSQVFAHLHASCTEWKNLFDFEVFTRTAKLQIYGLGRSYGVEEFRRYQMKPEMGPPDLTTETFPGEDRSWNDEFDAFLSERKGVATDIGKISDAVAAVTVVYEAYAANGFSDVVSN